MTDSTRRTATPKATLGRRAFLKGSAAALGFAALAATGCSKAEEPAPEPDAADGDGALAEPVAQAEPKPTAPPEEIYQGVCRGNCGGGCRMNVHVREGKVVKTSVIEAEDPLDTRLCARGLSHAQRIYDPDRLQYPLRRVEGTERGAGEWERLSWEEAIDYVAQKWLSYIEEFGGSSVGMTYGAGTYAYNQYVYQHLFNRFGGTNWDQGYDMTSLNVGKSMLGRGIYLHGNNGSDCINSKYIVYWGCSGSNAQPMRWTYVREAVKRGAKVIVIDPLYTDPAARADLWVPIKPGTDAALALALCKVVIDEGLQDDAYIKSMTVGPYLVKDDGRYLRMSDLGVEPTEGPADRAGNLTYIDPVAVAGPDGTFGPAGEVADPQIRGTFDADGIAVQPAFEKLCQHVAEWDAARAAEICEIDEKVIPQIARMYAEGPTNLEIGFGMDHRSHGAEATMGVFTLQMITGQLGKTGAGIGGTMGGSTMGTHCVNFLAGLYPESPVPMTSLCIDQLPTVVREQTYAGKPMVPKSLLFFCGNFMSNMSGRTELLEALADVELLVTCDTVMNDTARLSDVVLPVPHWFEYETFITCPMPYAYFNDEAVPPAFECKPDVEIVRMLAEVMGYDSTPYADNASYQALFLTGDAAAAWNLNWDDLKAKKSIAVCPNPYLFGNPNDDTFKFGTETGKAEFYFENPRPWFDIGQDFDAEPWHLATYQPTTEAYNPDNPLSAKYPLNIVTQRNRLKVHTQFSTHPWFEELQPEPTLAMNEADAKARGIHENDYVRVFNDRGHVVLRAHLDAGVRPGMVRTEHTWWDKQYKDGSFPSLLPLPQGTFRPGVHPFDTLCEVEKTTI